MLRKRRFYVMKVERNAPRIVKLWLEVLNGYILFILDCIYLVIYSLFNDDLSLQRRMKRL
jgi:hypothetical protein